jgi:hypothetical protein
MQAFVLWYGRCQVHKGSATMPPLPSLLSLAKCNHNHKIVRVKARWAEVGQVTRKAWQDKKRTWVQARLGMGAGTRARWLFVGTWFSQTIAEDEVVHDAILYISLDRDPATYLYISVSPG